MPVCFRGTDICRRVSGVLTFAGVFQGYPYLDNKREYHFSERASDVMTCRDLFVLSMSDPLHNPVH